MPITWEINTNLNDFAEYCNVLSDVILKELPIYFRSSDLQSVHCKCRCDKLINLGT